VYRELLLSGAGARPTNSEKCNAMTQHFTRNTISAEFNCAKCAKPTQHRIDNGWKGPCLECIERLRVEHAENEIEMRRAAKAPKQTEMFA